MAISSPGIGSSLDVNSIVNQLMAVEAQPLNTLSKKEASYQAKVSAFGSLSSNLGTFQTALAALNTQAKFQAVSATSADATIVSGTATSKAVAGSYTVEVTKLAQAQTIATAGQATTTSDIGGGAATTLTFQFGTISGGTLLNGVYNPAAAFAQDANQASGSVIIDDTNNSLQGIRDAINKAAIGVTATIVSDGSATPNHLVLTSNKTGATSSMKISVSGDSALQDLLAYDATGTQNMTQSSAGQNTALTVNGIAISGTSKTISEAIQGVTLNVSKIGSTTMTVAADTASVQTGITAFVKAYNDLDKTIKSLTAYNPTTKVGGALLGDSAVRNIQAKMRSMLGSSLTGTGGSLTSLSQIGVSFQKDGSLALDSAKLQTAMTANFNDIASLFAAIGTTTDSLVSFTSSTSATKPGNSAVHLTALATRGTVSGSATVNTDVAAGVNDQLAMIIDGISATVALTPGTSYTLSSLTAHMQSAINGTSAFSKAGITVSVSADAGGIISITSNRYGSASNVSVSGAGDLLPAPVSIAGSDVAGTIGGVTATGSGQFLTGAAGSTSEGLKLEITGGSAPSDRGNVNFSHGYAYLLNEMAGNFLGTSGIISGRTEGLKSSIKDVGKSRDAFNVKLAAIEKRYRAQYTALDNIISKMSTTSTFLTQQLAQFSNL